MKIYCQETKKIVGEADLGFDYIVGDVVKMDKKIEFRVFRHDEEVPDYCESFKIFRVQSFVDTRISLKAIPAILVETKKDLEDYFWRYI